MTQDSLNDKLFYISMFYNFTTITKQTAIIKSLSSLTLPTEQ